MLITFFSGWTFTTWLKPSSCKVEAKSRKVAKNQISFSLVLSSSSRCLALERQAGMRAGWGWPAHLKLWRCLYHHNIIHNHFKPFLGSVKIRNNTISQTSSEKKCPDGEERKWANAKSFIKFDIGREKRAAYLKYGRKNGSIISWSGRNTVCPFVKRLSSSYPLKTLRIGCASRTGLTLV